MANVPNKKLSFTTFLQRLLHKPVKFCLKHLDSRLLGFKLNVDKEFYDAKSSDSKIYVSSHQNFYDIINIINAIPGPVVIMNSVDVPSIIKLLLLINGVIFIDRKDKDSAFDGKTEAMEYLAKGYSLVIFSEATFNGSPNKYSLPFCHGAFDIAQKMRRVIVPIVQNYILDLNSKELNPVVACNFKFLPEISIPVVDSRRELYDYVSDVRNLMATYIHQLIEKKYLEYGKKPSDLFLGEVKRINILELITEDVLMSLGYGQNDLDKVVEEFGLLQYVSSHETNLKQRTLAYRKSVIGQFATFRKMGVSYQKDELISIQKRNYGYVSKTNHLLDFDMPPLNMVAWDPDTYELLDCGIKEIYFKDDIAKKTRKALRGIFGISDVKLHFLGSNIIIDVKSNKKVNESEIGKIITSKYPSDIIKYYSICISINGSLTYGTLLDDEDILIIPDREGKILTEPYTSDIDALPHMFDDRSSEKTAFYFLDRFVKYDVIDEGRRDMIANIYVNKIVDAYEHKKSNYDIFTLIDDLFALGIISSRQRNKMLSIICYETSSYQFEFDEIKKYSEVNDPALRCKTKSRIQKS